MKFSQYNILKEYSFVFSKNIEKRNKFYLNEFLINSKSVKDADKSSNHNHKCAKKPIATCRRILEEYSVQNT